MPRGLMMIGVIALTAWGCGSATARGPTLRSAGEHAGRWIGAAVQAGLLTSDSDYAGTLAREFDYLTAENEMKWGPIHPEPDTWNFAPADAIVEFAEAHSMRVKGHNLVWHMQLPGYVNTEMTADELRATMEEHIRMVVGRYRGRIVAWDVVNEPIAENGRGLRASLFLDKLGPGYIADALRWAHDADPDALLFINEYGADGLNAKSNTLFDLVEDLLHEGVPISGVGFQMHLGYVFGRPPATVRQNLERFAALGLLVNISEMDVQIKNLPGDLEARLAAQAVTYHDIVADCVAVPACHAVTFWGFTDKSSWIDSFFGDDDPLLFDASYKPKPAYFGVLDALQGR